MTSHRALRRTGALAASVLAATLVLASCGSPQASPASSAGAGASFPVEVTDYYGTTTIEQEPSRVVTVGWGSEDAAIGLGVIPVSIPHAYFGDPDGDGYLSWVKKAVEEANGELPSLHDESDGIPYDVINDADPDLILGTNSGLTQQERDTLAKIAPTIAFPKISWGTPWRDSTLLVGQSLGIQEQAKTLISQTEETIGKEMANHPEVAGKSVVVMWVDANDLGKVNFYTPTDTRVQYLNDLGLVTPQSVKTLSEGADSFVAQISAEEADKLDADIAVIYVQGGDLSTLKNDPRLSKIPAVQRGSVMILTDDEQLMAISAPTVLSIPHALSDYAKALADAAASVR
jgi:iron complex transport system substrate-binding protein